MTSRNTTKERTIISKKIDNANHGLLDILRDRARRKFGKNEGSS